MHPEPPALEYMMGGPTKDSQPKKSLTESQNQLESIIMSNKNRGNISKRQASSSEEEEGLHNTTDNSHLTDKRQAKEITMYQYC